MSQANFKSGISEGTEQVGAENQKPYTRSEVFPIGDEEGKTFQNRKGMRNKIFSMLAAGALAAEALGMPSEARAQARPEDQQEQQEQEEEKRGPNLIGLRLRGLVSAEIPVNDNMFFSKIRIDGNGTFSTWNNEYDINLSAGVGVVDTGFLNIAVSGGGFTQGCNYDPSNVASNCANGTSRPAQSNLNKPLTLGGGTFNANVAGALGPVSYNAYAAALLGNKISLLGIAKLAVQITDDEGSGFSVSGNGQIRDNVLSIGGGANYKLVWGTCGNNGRIHGLQFSNTWYAYTLIGSGQYDLISFGTVSYSTEVRQCQHPNPTNFLY